jgi:hypothetical protein
MPNLIDLRVEIPYGRLPVDRIVRFFSSLDSPVPGCKSTLTKVSDENYYYLMLMPFSDSEIQVVLKDKTLIAYAVTGIFGPGYHAYLIEVFEDFARRFTLQPKFYDAVGYVQDRDFEKLKAETISWMGEQSDLVLTLAENTPGDLIKLHFTTEFSPIAKSKFAYGRLGYFDRTFFESIINQTITEEEISAYFIWWNKEKDGSFYLQCAKSIMWCNLNWVAPTSPEEQAPYVCTILCLEQAYDMDPTLDFPTGEWYIAAAMLNEDELIKGLTSRFGEDIAKQVPTIGFFRGYVERVLFNRWYLVMPGMMRRIDDKASYRWIGNDKAITITNSKLSSEQEANYETVFKEIGKTLGKQLFDVDLKNPEVVAKITYGKNKVESLGYYAVLVVLYKNEILRMEVTYLFEDEKELVTNICGSVRLIEAMIPTSVS